MRTLLNPLLCMLRVAFGYAVLFFSIPLTLILAVAWIDFASNLPLNHALGGFLCLMNPGFIVLACGKLAFDMATGLSAYASNDKTQHEDVTTLAGSN